MHNSWSKKNYPGTPIGHITHRGLDRWHPGGRLGGSWLHDKLCTCFFMSISSKVSGEVPSEKGFLGKRTWEWDSEQFSEVLLLVCKTLPGRLTGFSPQLRAPEIWIFKPSWWPWTSRWFLPSTHLWTLPSSWRAIQTSRFPFAQILVNKKLFYYHGWFTTMVLLPWTFLSRSSWFSHSHHVLGWSWFSSDENPGTQVL